MWFWKINLGALWSLGGRGGLTGQRLLPPGGPDSMTGGRWQDKDKGGTLWQGGDGEQGTDAGGGPGEGV